MSRELFTERTRNWKKTFSVDLHLKISSCTYITNQETNRIYFVEILKMRWGLFSILFYVNLQSFLCDLGEQCIWLFVCIRPFAERATMSSLRSEDFECCPDKHNFDQFETLTSLLTTSKVYMWFFRATHRFYDLISCANVLCIFTNPYKTSL